MRATEWFNGGMLAGHRLPAVDHWEVGPIRVTAQALLFTRRDLASGEEPDLPLGSPWRFAGIQGAWVTEFFADGSEAGQSPR